MILSKIWERYFFKEVTKVFILFLFLFFVGYSLLEYSIHMQDFAKDKNLKVYDVLTYFFYQFIKRATLLIPLGFLVAVIKTLCTANARKELVALQAAGISIKLILRPFFILGALLVVFIGFSTESLLPKSLTYLDEFRYAHFKHSQYGERKEPIHVFYLNDNSKLIFQHFDQKNELFLDVIWVISIDDIWRMKKLEANPSQPIAHFADHITRTKSGILEKTESFETHLLNGLTWDKKMARKGFTPLENRAVSALYKLYSQSSNPLQQAEALSQVLIKSVQMLLPLLAVLGVAPYCIRYSRGIPLLFIYAVALFGFLALFTFLNATVILAENNVIHPLLAITGPFACVLLACLFRFKKIS